MPAVAVRVHQGGLVHARVEAQRVRGHHVIRERAWEDDVVAVHLEADLGTPGHRGDRQSGIDAPDQECVRLHRPCEESFAVVDAADRQIAAVPAVAVGVEELGFVIARVEAHGEGVDLVVAKRSLCDHFVAIDL